MKAGIKTNLLILAGLLISQGAFGMNLKQRAQTSRSTKLYNLGKSVIVVKGAVGSWRISPPLNDKGKLVADNFVTFQSGLQNNLTIEIGIPPLAVLHFDMSEIKAHFAEIVNAKYVSNGTLQVYGRLLRNSANRNEERDEEWHLNQLENYCSAMGCQITKKKTELYYYTISNIRPKQGVREDFAGALDTATRITHPTKFTNTTTQLIEVKGRVRFAKIQPEQTESFQTGLQNNLQIKTRIDGREAILEFDLKQIKDQFTWIKKVQLETTWDQKAPGQITQRFSLLINGVPKKDVSANESGKRKAILEGMYPASQVKEELDGTITVRDFRPKK